MTMRDNTFHIGFAPSTVAGMRTQWENMRPHVWERPDVTAHVAEIDKYKAGGLVEALPLVPPVIKGNVRSIICASSLFRARRLDALWMHEIRPALPYVLSKGLLQHTVLVSSTDSTSGLQARFGDLYAKAPSTSLRGRARDAVDTFCLTRLTALFPWSEWAARSLRDDHGFPPHKIHVIPPGIDLDRWPMVARQRAQDDVVRLLFVGGDFARKGGDLLLDVFKERLQGRCELHLVTRDDVPAQPGVFVYRSFGPNDPALRALYGRCDIFVLPTRADCFSLASMEAMATGLPVVTSAVGGIPEIVAEGRSGFLIAPDDGLALAQRLDTLVNAPELRATMGAEGRRIVEARFDAARNTARLLDLTMDLCRRKEVARAGTPADQRHA
jgi:glycosyltransferase involved in cell wall biosynthesis